MGGRGSAGRAHAVTAGSTPIQAVQPPTEQVRVDQDTASDQQTALVNRRWERFVHDAITQVIANRSYDYNDFVGMTELRAALDARGTTRAAQDKQLKRMSIDGTIILYPESNRKMLTDADHAAAIRIGNDYCHIICWGEGHHRISPEQ
jgi:hypothetical protein